MKFTEGGFRDWGYQLAKEEFGAVELDGGPWCTMKNPITENEIIIKDVIADAMLQQIITRPAEYSVLATMNLNAYLRRTRCSSWGYWYCSRSEHQLRYGYRPSKQPTELHQNMQDKTRSIPIVYSLCRNDATSHGLGRSCGFDC